MAKTACWTRSLLFAACALAPSAAAADPGYAVAARWPLAGDSGWDYLSVDDSGERLFVTRSDHVAVLDLAHGAPLGEVAPTAGVHGVALAPTLGKGYASNGRADSVSVFDLETLAIHATIAIAGHNPDAIVFDAPSARVFTFNGRSHDATVIDTHSDTVQATIALAGKPEFAVSDGNGRLYVNIEDRAELSAIDTRAMKVVATWPLDGCEAPTGLALDARHARLFSVCQNGRLVVTDAQSGRAVATLPIGRGPDGVAFDAARARVFSSNGEDGTLSVIRQDAPDRYTLLGHLPTQRSARTLALDPRTHRLYLSAAEFEAAPAPHTHAAIKPGSFAVLVVAPTRTP